MTPGAIHIATRPQYLADRSAPDEQHYVFAYTITIRNDGNERVRLISRRWLITDANGKKIEVEGIRIATVRGLGYCLERVATATTTAAAHG